MKSKKQFRNFFLSSITHEQCIEIRLKNYSRYFIYFFSVRRHQMSNFIIYCKFSNNRYVHVKFHLNKFTRAAFHITTVRNEI